MAAATAPGIPVATSSTHWLNWSGQVNKPSKLFSRKQESCCSAQSCSVGEPSCAETRAVPDNAKPSAVQAASMTNREVDVRSIGSVLFIKITQSRLRTRGAANGADWYDEVPSATAERS